MPITGRYLRISGSPQDSSFSAPVRAGPVNLFDGLSYFMPRAEFIDRPLARRPAVVVVNDDEASVRDFAVQIYENIHSRFVHITVETQNGKLFKRRRWQRVFEPAL